MKSFNKVAACILAAVLITACNKEDKAENNDIVPVRFSAQIGEQSDEIKAQSRAADAAWDPGDAVGVYMVKNGTISPVAGAENKKFITSNGDGEFEADSDEDEIYYPVDASDTFDFIVYYPYKQTGTGEIENHIYPVNVSDQRKQEDIDLLWGTSHDMNDQGYNKYNPTAELGFEHTLSKFILHTRAGKRIEAVDLENMVVTIKGMHTEAEFDLLNGGDISDIKNRGDITLQYAGTERLGSYDYPIYEAILLPDDHGDLEVTFELANGDVYTWYTSDISGGLSLEKGKKHTWTITVQRKPVLLSFGIENWSTGPGGRGEAW